ncbi:MAG: hypothetical protein ACREQA_20380 [Candidatus Binatia bacterium]
MKTLPTLLLAVLLLGCVTSCATYNHNLSSRICRVDPSSERCKLVQAWEQDQGRLKGERLRTEVAVGISAGLAGCVLLLPVCIVTEGKVGDLFYPIGKAAAEKSYPYEMFQPPEEFEEWAREADKIWSQPKPYVPRYNCERDPQTKEWNCPYDQK